MSGQVVAGKYPSAQGIDETCRQRKANPVKKTINLQIFNRLRFISSPPIISFQDKAYPITGKPADLLINYFYAFALFLQGLDFTGLAIRGNFQGFQGDKKFLQKCSYFFLTITSLTGR